VTGLSHEVDRSIEDLKRAIVEAVRSVSPDVDRRATPRYPSDLACSAELLGHRFVGSCRNISLGGAYLLLDCERERIAPGATGRMVSAPCPEGLSFVVVAHEPDGIRIRWQPGMIAPAVLERLVPRARAA
jgi:hypothetical protein